MNDSRDNAFPSIPGWEILDLLGRGGMGTVYLARSKTVSQPLALKVIDPAFAQQPAFRRYFIREISTAVALHHPHILPILNYSPDPETGALYFATPVVGDESCRSLSDLVATQGTLDPTLTASLVAQVADALAYAHAQDPPVVHRDISPSNVLLRRMPTGSLQALLADFGIAFPLPQEARAAITQPESLIPGAGKPQYMAPEQFDDVEFGPITPRTDLYQLGVVAFECLTGQLPYQETNAIRLSDCHRRTPVPALSEAECPDPRWRTLIGNLMAKRPADRPKNAAAVRDELFDISRGKTPPSAPVVEGETTEKGAVGPDSTAPSPAVKPKQHPRPTPRPTVVQTATPSTNTSQPKQPRGGKGKKIALWILLAALVWVILHLSIWQYRARRSASPGETPLVVSEDDQQTQAGEGGDDQTLDGQTGTGAPDDESSTNTEGDGSSPDQGELPPDDHGDEPAETEDDESTQDPSWEAVDPGRNQQHLEQLLAMLSEPSPALKQLTASAYDLVRQVEQAKRDGNIATADRLAQQAEDEFERVITEWIACPPWPLTIQIGETEEPVIRLTLRRPEGPDIVLQREHETSSGFHQVFADDQQNRLVGEFVVSVTTPDELYAYPLDTPASRSVQVNLGRNDLPPYPGERGGFGPYIFVPEISREDRELLQRRRSLLAEQQRSTDLVARIGPLLEQGQLIYGRIEAIGDEVRDLPADERRRIVGRDVTPLAQQWRSEVQTPVLELLTQLEDSLNALADNPLTDDVEERRRQYDDLRQRLQEQDAVELRTRFLT